MLQLHAYWAVTTGCGDVCPYVPTTVYAWDIPDPARRPVGEVREIGDMIGGHVRELAQDLTKLLPQLISEFGETRPAEVIRGGADRILDDYDDVPVRSHIMTLAHKRTPTAFAKTSANV